MAFDGIMTAAMAIELKTALDGAKIEKIYQPETEELLLHLHTRDGKKKLLLSASSHHAGVHLTEESYENPAQPSSFCMLLRKHLQSGRITDVSQAGSERILELGIETLDEMGFNVNRKLIAEIMGKHSNITLIDAGSGKVIDSIKRISIDTSRVRQLLPGIIYEYPPVQDKIPFREVIPEDVEKMAEKRILDCIGGISPAISDELECDGRDHIYEKLDHIRKLIYEGSLSPAVYLKEDGSPMDFTVIPLSAYEGILEKVSFETASEAAEYYFSHKASSNRIKQKSADLKKAVDQKLKKAYLKKQKLSEDLLKAENSEDLRLFGELLTANLHLCRTGDTSVRVINYYDGKELDIPLDKRFSPSKNAQNYYKRYGKSKTAIKEKKIQLEDNEKDISYLESVSALLDNAENAETIDSIRNELIEEGYLRRRKNVPFQKKQKMKPLEYHSSKGYRILVGRNNIENDHLTLRMAGKTDLWLHTKDIPGSHVIVFLEGNAPDEDTIFEAAKIAAYHSKARESAQVPVDYVPVRYVKKPNGAKPGMVIFTNNRTVYVTPEIPK